MRHPGGGCPPWSPGLYSSAPANAVDMKTIHVQPADEAEGKHPRTIRAMPRARIGSFGWHDRQHRQGVQTALIKSASKGIKKTLRRVFKPQTIS